MSHGRQRVVQPWCASADGDEKAEKAPDGLDDRFCLTDPAAPGVIEDKGPKRCGFKVFGLLPECVQKLDDGPAVGVESRLRGPAMRAHPLSKHPEEFGLGRWREDQGRRRHQPRGFKEGDEVACTHKHGTIATARIAQGLAHLQMMTEPLKRFCIELLDAEPIVLCPVREAVYATNQAQDTARLIPTLLEPENEGIEMGTCGARTVSLEGEGPF